MMETGYLQSIALNFSEEDLEHGRRTGDSVLLEFPFTVPAVKALMDMDRLEFHPDVTFFIGENGAGKSTLLEAIADLRGHAEEGGSKNFNVNKEPFTILRTYLRQARRGPPADEFFIRGESLYNMAHTIDELDKVPFCGSIYGSYGGKSLLKRSHGEGFMALMKHRTGGRGLYLIDEPEAALSVQSQFAALGFMRSLVQSQSQFIIATHSPILLAYPDAWIYRFSEEGIERVTYEESEPYLLTRAFVENPKRMIWQIFGEDGAAPETGAARRKPFSK